jgi:hypothetical protein
MNYIECVQQGRQISGLLESRSVRSTHTMCDTRDGIDGFADLLEDKVTVLPGFRKFRMPHIGLQFAIGAVLISAVWRRFILRYLRRSQQHQAVFLQHGSGGGEIVAHTRVLQFSLAESSLHGQITDCIIEELILLHQFLLAGSVAKTFEIGFHLREKNSSLSDYYQVFKFLIKLRKIKETLLEFAQLSVKLARRAKSKRVRKTFSTLWGYYWIIF